MAKQHIFDFNAGDVFTPGNNDIFGTVFNLYIPIRMTDGNITGVKPTSGKGRCRRDRILQIPFHDDVTPHENFPLGLTVPGYWFQCFSVSNHHGTREYRRNALPGFEVCFFFQRKAIPFFAPG